jgi:hypothetical protein
VLVLLWEGRKAMNIPAQDCPECGEKVECSGAIGLTDGGTPIASVYEEYYRCLKCEYSWYYRPSSHTRGIDDDIY